MQVEKNFFWDLLDRFEDVPFLSAKGWDFLEENNKKVYFLNNTVNPTIGAWGRIFSVPFIGDILQIQSEVLNSPSDEETFSFYHDIINDDYSMILVSSLRSPSPNLEYTMRKAGFVRPYGLSLCPLTVIVNTERPELQHHSWKKNVKRAQKNNLAFLRVMDPKFDDCIIFSKIYEEMAIEKMIKHRIHAKKIFGLLSDPAFELYFVYKDNEVLSAEIVYVKNKAEGVFAANSAAGKKCGASYFLREKLFENLRERGIKFFDFSRIAPGLNSANSLCEFKLSSGGTITQYFGEWVWTKNKYIELLYLIYRQFLSNGARY